MSAAMHIPPRLMVTLWPSFLHFQRFAQDGRLAGIRLNSAQMSLFELEDELAIVAATKTVCPLYYDIKARQPRIIEVEYFDDHLEVCLNHPISVPVPTPVLFKAGVESAELVRLEDHGRRLVFAPMQPTMELEDGRIMGGSMVKVGESIHIRHPAYRMLGPVFTEDEKKKIQRTREAGFTRYFLSYVEAQSDVDEFIELVGPDVQIMLKIETKAGVEYATKVFRKRPNLVLVAARGDLYVEIDKPHQMPRYTRAILDADPEAIVGSRILLSSIHQRVPECVDFSELAWLYDIGYRTMMLCDELCLKEELLSRAVTAFDMFKHDYVGALNANQ